MYIPSQSVIKTSHYKRTMSLEWLILECLSYVHNYYENFNLVQAFVNLVPLHTVECTLNDI